MRSDLGFSFWYPTQIDPLHQQTALQGDMAAKFQVLAQYLVRPGSDWPQNYSLKLLAALRSDIRETLSASLDRIGGRIQQFAERFSWEIGNLHAELAEQTGILRTIAEQQRIPIDLEASNYFMAGQQLATECVDGINTGRLDDGRAQQLFRAIRERYTKARELLPSGSVMYSILIGEAELHLLEHKDGEAAQDFEESVAYAPRDRGFDHQSYSYRMLGRIAFVQGDPTRAAKMLEQAVKASPDYGIGWYQYAKYLAQTWNPDFRAPAIDALERATALKKGFWYVAARDQDFDPIREQVDTLRRKVLEETRRACLELFQAIDQKTRRITKQLDERYEIIVEIEQTIASAWVAIYGKSSDQLGYPSPAGLKSTAATWMKATATLMETAKTSKDLDELHQLLELLPAHAKTGVELEVKVRKSLGPKEYLWFARYLVNEGTAKDSRWQEMPGWDSLEHRLRKLLAKFEGKTYEPTPAAAKEPIPEEPVHYDKVKLREAYKNRWILIALLAALGLPLFGALSLSWPISGGWLALIVIAETIVCLCSFANELLILDQLKAKAREESQPPTQS